MVYKDVLHFPEPKNPLILVRSFQSGAATLLSVGRSVLVLGLVIERLASGAP
jgi:hypothetical protein